MTTKAADTDDAPEAISQCEGCSKPIHDGDSYHAGSDVDLCAECAPTFADLLSSPASFADTEDEPLTADAAQAIYDAHVAAGGQPTDKIGIRS